MVGESPLLTEINIATQRERMARGATAKMTADGAVLVPKAKLVASETHFIDPLQDPRWPALVAAHPRASLFHSVGWLSALRNVYGYEPVAITTCSPGTALTNGLVFCRVKSWLTGRRLVSLPFSDHCELLVDGADELDTMLLPLRQQVERGQWKYLEIRPLCHVPSAHAGLSRLVTYSYHSLDLAPSLEQLFQNFHKDCVQRKIRRAEREKLKYEEGRSEALLQEFFRLLVMTRRRQYLPPQPLAWFRGLIAAFGTDLKIRVASKGGIAVASILTLSHKKSMVYKYGCSDLAFNRLGGTALLFWKAIQEAKELGFQELEMGRSDTENVGLTAFKERWGASRSSVSYWTYPRNDSPGLSVWKQNVARRVVSSVPDLALETAGSLLYKHIG